MRYLNLIIVLTSIILFNCNNTLTAQPRIYETINSNWKFYKGEINSLPQKADSTIKWEYVSIPHSWNVADVMDDEPSYYRGTGWYEKQLFVPSSWQKKDIYLFFEGASQVTEVYINGKKVGDHIGGYTAFSFLINDFLKLGNEANDLLVKVNNSYNADIPPLSADFTFYGGIYRDVNLIAVDQVHFDMDNHASNGVFITTPKVNESTADMSVKGSFINKSTARTVLVQTRLLDADGKSIAHVQTKIKAAVNQPLPFQQDITNIIAPKLWSPESPYLYKVVTSLVDSKTKVILDEIISPLGFRWFTFDSTNGFFLNGKPCKLIGASRHQDYKDMANALPDALHVRDVELLKEMGGNFLRVAHYPQDPEVLEACDRLGILASVEIPIVNQITESEAFSNNCKNMQVEMIKQNFNHPSLIIWTYMNEVLLRMKYEKGSEKRAAYIKNVAKLGRELENITRQEDPYRYTMIPNHGDFDLYNNAGLTQIPKIVGWNLYKGWYDGDLVGFASFLDKHHRELPNKSVIVSEYGADADPRLHSLQPVKFDKSNEFAVIFHKAYLKAINERPFVAGAAIWNLVDFNSEQRIETMPHINLKGILTTDRREKNSYLFYQANLIKEPYIRIGSKLWLLRSGVADSSANLQCTQPVEIFSNQKKVTLKLNGHTLGEKETDQGYVEFDVPFINGINKVEALIDVNGKIYTDAENIEFKLIPANLKSKEIPFTEINVSLGDKRYFIDEKLHQVWIPEKPYSEGSWGYIGGEVFTMKRSNHSFGSDKNILGTDYDPIYETQRVGIEKFKLDVPDGVYEVTLHFAELLSDKQREELVYNLTSDTAKKKDNASLRLFDVTINNSKVFENLGNSSYLIPERAVSSKVTIEALNGEGITIGFVPKAGQAILNGLQVRKIY
jgi:beta-galactosidase